MLSHVVALQDIHTVFFGVYLCHVIDDIGGLFRYTKWSYMYEHDWTHCFKQVRSGEEVAILSVVARRNVYQSYSPYEAVSSSEGSVLISHGHWPCS